MQRVQKLIMLRLFSNSPLPLALKNFDTLVKMKIFINIY